MLTYTADIFVKSGGVGIVSAVVLFICLGIGLERLLFWGGLWGLPMPFALLGLDGVAGRADRVARLVRAGQYRSAGREAGRSVNPALRALGAALRELKHPRAWRATRDSVLAESFGANVTLGRRFLITAIQAFGLLGMLGTCKGLYSQLSAFGQTMGGASSLQGAMGGMGEAFTTTLVGLTAAVVVTLIYLPNEVAIDHFRRQVARFNARIEAAIAESGGWRKGDDDA